MIFAVCLFLALGAYQLHLPGLHYDEAKEAGLNAMELLTGQPVTAFRGAIVQAGAWRLPLMVQDYIGSLNVLLALPFLAAGGINAVALRWLPLLIAALTLVITWHVAERLGGSAAAIASALLLAVNPAFIFWSRQGIFVTNLTGLLLMASLLAGLRWWQGRRPADLWLTAFLWGLGLYAKLLFAWAIGAMIGLAAFGWLFDRLSSRRRSREPGTGEQEHMARTRPAAASSSRRPSRPQRASAPALTVMLALVSFLVPLVPLILFNIQTSGTLTSIFGNLGQSYYGIDNSAYLPNLLTRLQQVLALIRGDFLWYLGEMFANPAAPWFLFGLAVLAVAAWGLGLRPKGQAVWNGLPPAFIPLILLALIVAQSAFTVSDLFITHYALLVPLIPLAGGLAFGTVWDFRRRGSAARDLRLRFLMIALSLGALLAWAGGDFWTALRYHGVLAISGGVGGHSDAIYSLAEHLDCSGAGTTVALDWGLDAPVRFLTAGRVRPIEVFGYGGLEQPDPGFAERVAPFLDQPETLYLAHAPDKTVFKGRLESLAALATERGLTLREEAHFAERSGNPLLVVHRARK